MACVYLHPRLLYSEHLLRSRGGSKSWGVSTHWSRWARPPTTDWAWRSRLAGAGGEMAAYTWKPVKRSAFKYNNIVIDVIGFGRGSVAIRSHIPDSPKRTHGLPGHKNVDFVRTPGLLFGVLRQVHHWTPPASTRNLHRTSIECVFSRL